MPRKLLFVPLLAVAIVMAAAPASQAQETQVYDDPVYDQEQASVFSVPGRVVRVIYDQGSYTADGQYVFFDQVIARYYGPDRQLREGLADAPSTDGDIRPASGDAVTCEIDAVNYGLLAVNGWYRLSRPNLYFVYEPIYYRHRLTIIWPEYYQRHFGGYYYGPRYYGGHRYRGPRYHSRDEWNHRPRYGTPPPHYRRDDRGGHQGQYGSPGPTTHRSPGEYQRPGGRGQYRPPTSRRTGLPDDQVIRPRPDISPGSPSDRPREQRPSSGQQYRAPEQRERRPTPVERSRRSEDRSSRSQGDRPRQKR
jgi:hypothetical protein